MKIYSSEFIGLWIRICRSRRQGSQGVAAPKRGPNVLDGGFTLIELMIVIAIIGILAAVAVPSYQDYIGRAQMAEAITLMHGAKSPIMEFFYQQGQWPSIGDVGVAGVDLNIKAKGTYTASVVDANAYAGTTGLNYTLKATMNATGVNNNLAGRVVYLATLDGGKAWQCGINAIFVPAVDVARRYLPVACDANITP